MSASRQPSSSSPFVMEEARIGIALDGRLPASQPTTRLTSDPATGDARSIQSRTLKRHHELNAPLPVHVSKTVRQKPTLTGRTALDPSRSLRRRAGDPERRRSLTGTESGFAPNLVAAMPDLLSKSGHSDKRDV